MFRKWRSPVTVIIAVLVLLASAAATIFTSSSAAVVRPTLTLVNDANLDGTFSASETVPFNATYPRVVPFQMNLSTAGMAQSITITGVANDQTTGLGDCPALVGKVLQPNQSVSCSFTLTLTGPSTSPIVSNFSISYDSAGSDVARVQSTIDFQQTPPPATPTPTPTPPPPPTEPPNPPVQVANASIAQNARCTVKGKGAVHPFKTGGTNRAFAVTVTVSGPSGNVKQVEFRRNGKLVKVRKSANGGLGKYVLKVKPSKLKLNHQYVIKARVLLRSPGSFTQKAGSLSKVLKGAMFVPLASCEKPPPPPTAG